MKSVSFHSSLLCLLLLAAIARGQTRSGWGYSHTALAVLKTQPLVVLLEEEDPKQLSKLANRPDDLAQYKAYVAYYNTQMRELAPKLWHFSPAVEFKPKSELKELRQLKNTLTVALERTQDRLGDYENGRAVSLSSAIVAQMRLIVVGDGKIDFRESCSSYPGALYPSDIIFTFRTIQQSLDDEAAGRERKIETKKESEARWTKQGQELRTKTLLLDQDEVDAKLTEADIKALYPYAYQLVPRATIEAAVSNADARYVYVRWLTYSAGIIGQMLINADDCRVLGQSGASSGPGRNPWRPTLSGKIR